MADLRLESHVEAHVDRFGNAAKTRRWCFSNLSSTPLDLNAFFMWFDVTSPSVHLEGSQSSDGRQVQATTSPAPGGGMRIECSFDKVLAAGETYAVELAYRYNRYFRYLSRTGVWFLSEWFARFGPLTDPGFSQEEPQRLCFELTIDDPRGRLVGVLQTFEWDADPPPDTHEKRGRTVRLCWDRNLKPDERTDDIIVAYRVRWIIEKLGPVIRWALPFLPKPG